MPESFVLDTAVLLDFFVRRYSDDHGVDWLVQRLPPVILVEEYLYLGFRDFLVANRGRFITTAGVVAELQGHARRAEQRRDRGQSEFQASFWRLVHDWFHQIAVHEHHFRLVDMSPDMVGKLGPVDAGLIGIAKQRLGAQERCITLASDADFYQRCVAEEVNVEWVTSRIDDFLLNR